VVEADIGHDVDNVTVPVDATARLQARPEAVACELACH
jgi:muramoyltetrapeptide carboxypeptidase LdcA involved in peptidoglycan recycling